MRLRVGKRIIIVGIIIIAIVTIAVLVLFLISGVFVKSIYLKPWDKNYAGTFQDSRIQVTTIGELAANGHNMQPWKVKLDKNDDRVFYLYADSNRFTDAVDPFARQLMITQGTFIELAAISGQKFGMDTLVTLFPEGNYDETNLIQSMDKLPVAQITLGAKANSQSEESLYNYIFMPDTNRMPYKDNSIPDADLQELADLNESKELEVKFYADEENKNKLSGLVMKGVNIEANTREVMEETEAIFRPNEYEKNQYGYGFSVEGQGTTGIMKHFLQGIVTLFPSMNRGKGSADLMIKSAKISVDNTPAYLLILSDDNSRESQIKSGRLYSRMILKGHQLGLVMQPLSQPLEEYSRMKEVYEEIHKEYGGQGKTIQMLIRVGYPTKEAPLSMRQEVEKFLITDEE